VTITATQPFTGFPAEGLAFLDGLREDNTKAFFEAHRTTYETALLAPARAFVVALGDELRSRVSPGIRAEPRVDGSILRMNRDTRFHHDKRPYKDHLDLVLWEGEAHSRERAGFFVRLRPEGVELSAGMRRFERPALDAYRAAVLDEHTGPALEEAVARATARRGVALEPANWKRAPRGYDPDHPRVALLLHGGLYAEGRWAVPRVIAKPAFVAWAAERLEGMAPVERWLTGVLDAAS
jgi:uncharacterized protein (TIGR02453 family)